MVSLISHVDCDGVSDIKWGVGRYKRYKIESVIVLVI